MSSISPKPRGHHWVHFAFEKRRHTVRLGVIERAGAEDFQRNLDRLISFRAAGVAFDVGLLAWIQGIGARPHATLATAGLVEVRAATTIAELVDHHIKGLKQKKRKQSTIDSVQMAFDTLTSFIPETKLIATVTMDDADSLRAWMLDEGGLNGRPLGRTTVSRQCRRIRELFKFAADRKWIQKNPFGHLKKWSEVNPDRDHYVSRDLFESLLGMTHDKELKALLAVVRYCGLRCPSEIQPLQWSWVQWDEGILRVLVPKTERYAGQKWREVPLFAEVLPCLEDAWDAAEERQPLVFPRHQTTNAAIAGRLATLCRKAGQALWPKPFINLRASCEHDLFDEYPINKVATWLGHSPEVALKHYNRVVKEQAARDAGARRVDVPEPTRRRNRRAVAPRKNSPTRT